MLYIKNNINIKNLEQIGFKSFKVNRDQTNYYFATRKNNAVVIVNSTDGSVLLDSIKDNDSRLHKIIQYQPKNAVVEDGIFKLINAGLAELR